MVSARGSLHSARGWPWTLAAAPITYYRRRAKGRQEAAAAAREAVFDRMAWQLGELRTHLDRLAAFNAVMAEELSR
jgi:hypothetical protein